MILSGADVLRYIKFGGLSFSPELGVDQFQQNGIDMVLGETEVDILGPGEFCLGATRETITMPNDLGALVCLRSTWARKGFMIPPTVIDAGFSGAITLEIASFARNRLPVGERFAHIVFLKTASPADPYRGKYQHQSGITGARF